MIKLFLIACLLFAGNHVLAIDFPQPSGPYTVGYKYIEFTDESRDDIYKPEGGKRKIKVIVYYPSNDPIKLEPYQKEDKSPAPNGAEKVVAELNALKVYRSANAAPTGETFPTIFFEPGAGSTPNTYISIIQELVSHGYIVVGLSHAYKITEIDEKVEEALDVHDFANLDPNHLATFIQADEEQNQVTNFCKDDTLFVLDHIRDECAYLGLDFNKLGIMGHSLGGTIMLRVIQSYPALKAGVCLDAPRFKHILTPNIPFLHLFAEQRHAKLWDKPDDYKLLMKNHFRVLLKNSGHNSFSNTAILQEILPSYRGFLEGGRAALDPVLGKADSVENMRVIITIVQSFFDKFFKSI
ncbi:MAG: hypothetical protein WCG04_05675, partial [Alphaproteobacteria bacterium]